MEPKFCKAPKKKAPGFLSRLFEILGLVFILISKLMFVFPFGCFSYVGLMEITKCTSLLPATCEVSNATNLCSVNVIPKNEDEPFVKHISSPLENGTRDCFYRTDFPCNHLQFESDHVKPHWIFYLFFIIPLVVVLCLCCCCCCCSSSKRRYTQTRCDTSSNATQAKDASNAKKTHDNGSNTAKKSNSHSTNFSDSEYTDSTSTSEISVDRKESRDSGSFNSEMV